MSLAAPLDLLPAPPAASHQLQPKGQGPSVRRAQGVRVRTKLAITRKGLDRCLKLAEWVHQLGRMESRPSQGPDA